MGNVVDATSFSTGQPKSCSQSAQSWKTPLTFCLSLFICHSYHFPTYNMIREIVAKESIVLNREKVL